MNSFYHKTNTQNIVYPIFPRKQYPKETNDMFGKIKLIGERSSKEYTPLST